jgi:hypothetical protein
MTWISEYVSSRSGAIGNFHNDMRLRSTLNAYWKLVRNARAALCAVWIILWVTVPCISSAQVQAPGLATEEKLIKDFTDPLTTLPQISLKDAFTPANFGTHVQTNQVILRPIIPRVPRFSLFPLIQLIRPTFSLVTVPSARGGTRTEFGDMQLFDLAILPWPRDEAHFKIGWGPMFVFPSATSRSAGQGAWQAGPAMGAVYTGIPWLVMGFLCRTRFLSLTPRPSGRPRTRSSFSQLWRFMSGKAGTCDLRRPPGRSAGVITRQPCCR